MNEQMRMELRVHQILDGELREDSFVEFKLDLPSEHRRASRRIAALANSARGAEVVWLIGVTDDGRVVGVQDAELSSWWPQVQRCFDETSPDLASVLVARPEGAVLGLFFNTDRAPFVHKTAGSPELEVPWREGTRTRSAKRHELLRILAPTVKMPDVEVLEAELRFGTTSGVHRPRDGSSSSAVDTEIEFRVDLFIESHVRASFPEHRQQMELSFPGVAEVSYSFVPLWYVEGIAYEHPRFIGGTAHVDEPCAVTLRGSEYRYMEPDMMARIGCEAVACSQIVLSVSGSSMKFAAELELNRIFPLSADVSDTPSSNKVSYRWALSNAA